MRFFSDSQDRDYFIKFTCNPDIHINKLFKYDL
jgi:hypothetical protein